MIILKRFAEWVTNCKKRISGSLTAKTFFVLLALFLLICFTTYIFIGFFLPYANQNQSTHQLDEKAKMLISELRKTPSSESGTLFIRFIQETGCDLNLMNERRETIDLFTFSENDSNDDLHGQEYPFRFADSNDEYVLIVNYNPARSEEISGAIWRSMPWVVGIILMMSIAGSFLFSRYTTRPIIRMSRTAANIADLDFSWYCPDLRDDEIGVLAKSLNELSDKLNEALSELRHKNLSLEDEITLEKEQERRRLLFFSGVSHELKTPIAIVIGQLEGIQAEIGVYKNKDKYLARSAEILRSLDSFIKEILLVSHMDSSNTTTFQKIDISSAIKSCVEDCMELAESCSVSIKSNIEENIFVSSDELLIKKAIGNIVSNAAIYSGENGLINVILSKNKTEAKLEIINTPAHIDEPHLPRLFEAFYRTEKHSGSISGQGSGLGLYITRMILDSHHAPHTIENHGDGVKFTVIFDVY